MRVCIYIYMIGWMEFSYVNECSLGRQKNLNLIYIVTCYIVTCYQLHILCEQKGRSQIIFSFITCPRLENHIFLEDQ